MMNDAPFFTNGNDNYASDYGRFFLTWYSNKLIQHGDDILAAARGVFGNRVELAGELFFCCIPYLILQCLLDRFRKLMYLFI